jgi:transcriptional regulator with XRE-family HTH domain
MLSNGWHAVKSHLATANKLLGSPVGNAIKGHRKRLGLSQVQLAERVGVSRVSVGAWETGDSEPSEENFQKLAELFQVQRVALRYPTLDTNRKEAVGVSEPSPNYARASDRVRLSAAAYERVYGYLARMESAGCTAEQVESARRLMVEFGGAILHAGPKDEKSIDDQLLDIDASWHAIRESINNREGKKL